MINLVTRLSQMSPEDLQRNTKQSLEWFRRAIATLPQSQSQRDADDIMESYPKTFYTILGGMYMFKYDAKYKDVLPYWDRYPLVIPFQLQTDGFYGLNLHYISPVKRAELLVELLRYPKDLDEGTEDDTRIRLTYQLIKATSRLKWARPCIKRYLTTHIDGNIREVPYKDWDIISLLPTYKFNINANTVYKHSREKVESYV